MRRMGDDCVVRRSDLIQVGRDQESFVFFDRRTREFLRMGDPASSSGSAGQAGAWIGAFVVPPVIQFIASFFADLGGRSSGPLLVAVGVVSAVPTLLLFVVGILRQHLALTPVQIRPAEISHIYDADRRERRLRWVFVAIWPLLIALAAAFTLDGEGPLYSIMLGITIGVLPYWAHIGSTQLALRRLLPRWLADQPPADGLDRHGWPPPSR